MGYRELRLGRAQAEPRMGVIQPRVPGSWGHRCVWEHHRREGLDAGPAEPSPVERWQELPLLGDQKDDETSTLGRMTDITGSPSHSIEPFSASRKASGEGYQEHRPIA